MKLKSKLVLGLAGILSGCGIANPLGSDFEYNFDKRYKIVVVKLEYLRVNTEAIPENYYKIYSKVLKDLESEISVDEKIYALEEVDRLLKIQEDIYMRKMRRESESLNKRERPLQGEI